MQLIYLQFKIGFLLFHIDWYSKISFSFFVKLNRKVFLYLRLYEKTLKIFISSPLKFYYRIQQLQRKLTIMYNMCTTQMQLLTFNFQCQTQRCFGQGGQEKSCFSIFLLNFFFWFQLYSLNLISFNEVQITFIFYQSGTYLHLKPNQCTNNKHITFFQASPYVNIMFKFVFFLTITLITCFFSFSGYVITQN